MTKVESVMDYANRWGEQHYTVLQPVLVTWLERNAPHEVKVPSVLGVIFHVSQSTDMVPKLFGENAQETPSDWMQFVEYIADRPTWSCSDRFMNVLANMTLARAKRGKAEWDLSGSPFIKWYESVAREGLLVKTFVRGKYKLDEDVYKVFGKAIVHKSEEADGPIWT